MNIEDVLSFARTCSEADARKIRTIVAARVHQFNQDKKTTKITVKYSEFGYQQAELIWNHAKEIYPHSKEPDLKLWAAEVDRISSIDKIPENVVEVVLMHALQDNFWKNQIRSPQALRRHFEKIYMNGKSKFDEKAAKRPKVYKV